MYFDFDEADDFNLVEAQGEGGSPAGGGYFDLDESGDLKSAEPPGEGGSPAGCGVATSGGEDAASSAGHPGPMAAAAAVVGDARASSSTARRDLEADTATLEDLATRAVARYGEPPPDEAQRQMALHLRLQRVQPLGAGWEMLERHPWRRVEMRRQEADARGVHDTSLRPSCFRRGSARDERERRCPRPGDRIQVRLRACARLGPRTGADSFSPLSLSEEWVDCILSDGSLPEGVEKALGRLAVGDVADVRCVGEACLRDVPAESIEHIPPEGFAVWEVFLLRIISVLGVDNPSAYTSPCATSPGMKLGRALDLRCRGNALMKAGRVVKAMEVYTLAADFVSMFEASPKDLGLQRSGPEMGGLQHADKLNKMLRDIRTPIILNHALAAQRLGRWQLGAELSGYILDENPACVKALFRHGRSLVRLGEFQKARQCLQQAQKLDESIAPQVRREVALLVRRQRGENKLRGNLPRTLGGSAAEAPVVAEDAAPDATGRVLRGHHLEVGDGDAEVSSDGSSAALSEEERRPEQPPAVVGRISVICPTTEARHAWHPQLYGCFLCQQHHDRELIVVDSGREPSPFFARLHDPSVRYVHIQGPAEARSIGAKRNVALAEASGEFVAHFDDDDLYASPYLETMLRSLLESGGDAVKLASWSTLDTQAGICGRLDSQSPLPERFEPLRQAGVFDFGYGFSLFYRREAALRVGFADTSWGEDIAFVKALLAANIPVSFCHDRDFICLHTQHGDNHSRSIAQNLVEPKAWKEFVVHSQRLAVAYVENLHELAPSVSFQGGWDVEKMVAGTIRAALSRGTARLREPDPVPVPAGLFVCSLYDEYYQAFEARWERRRQQRACGGDEAAPADDRAALLDPLSAWSADHTAGIAPLPRPQRGGACLAPDPLKPTEEIVQRSLIPVRSRRDKPAAKVLPKLARHAHPAHHGSKDTTPYSVVCSRWVLQWQRRRHR